MDGLNHWSVKEHLRHKHKIKDPLYVIAVISNPVRYHSRWALYHQFEHHVNASKDCVLYTVEAAYRDRPHMVTHHENPFHIQFRTEHELWHKENMINLGISRLPSDWKYVAWIDADIEFIRKDWVHETLQKLQHHMLVQIWEHCTDLGPKHEHISTHRSFISQYWHGEPYCYGNKRHGYQHWHPGYAWAARREAIECLGGLIDTAILGAGDNHMAHALIGMLDGTLDPGLHPNYVKLLRTWQERAERYIRRNVGFVEGGILHHWHGKKVDRKYHDRWKILVEHAYDPEKDIKRDWQGLYQLVDHGCHKSIHLRDEIRKYFHARNEDSVDR